MNHLVICENFLDNVLALHGSKVFDLGLKLAIFLMVMAMLHGDNLGLKMAIFLMVMAVLHDDNLGLKMAILSQVVSCGIISFVTLKRSRSFHFRFNNPTPQILREILQDSLPWEKIT